MLMNCSSYFKTDHFQAMGIESEEDVQALSRYFVKFQTTEVRGSLTLFSLLLAVIAQLHCF